MLLQGQRYKPHAALEVGLVHEVVDTPEELLAAAKAWVLANPEAKQPWDVPGYKIPGGDPKNPKFAANLPAFPANLRKQLKGANYPAPRNILAAAVEGARVDFDTALTDRGAVLRRAGHRPGREEHEQAFFFDMQNVNNGALAAGGRRAVEGTKVAVLGAGMMGAGIA